MLAPIPRANEVYDAFFDELSHHGLVEGKNLIVDPRAFSVPPSQLETVATELVKSGQDAIITSGPGSGHAAQHATQSIPIIAGMDDPLGSQLVASLPNPGGNMTGVGIFAFQLDAKRLELVHELVPTARRIGILADPATAASRPNVEATAHALGLELVLREARSPNDIPGAIEALAAAPVDAICVLASPILGGADALTLARVREARLPTIHQWPGTVRNGGLVAYGPSEDEIGRLLAQQLIRVLDGAAPAHLPVIQPTKFELWINLKTAKALGLEVPPTMLVRADQVIE
jgi:putative ABC transport system substrate-binding protein